MGPGFRGGDKVGTESRGGAWMRGGAKEGRSLMGWGLGSESGPARDKEAKLGGAIVEEGRGFG